MSLALVFLLLDAKRGCLGSPLVVTDQALGVLFLDDVTLQTKDPKEMDQLLPVGQIPVSTELPCAVINGLDRGKLPLASRMPTPTLTFVRHVDQVDLWQPRDTFVQPDYWLCLWNVEEEGDTTRIRSRSGCWPAERRTHLQSSTTSLLTFAGSSVWSGTESSPGNST
jgi:hypothetical protein